MLCQTLVKSRWIAAGSEEYKPLRLVPRRGWLVVGHRDRGNSICSATTIPLPHQDTIDYDGYPVQHAWPDPSRNSHVAYTAARSCSPPRPMIRPASWRPW